MLCKELIVLFFSIFFIVNCSFIYMGIPDTKFDLYLTILGVVTALFLLYGIYFASYFSIDFAHFTYGLYLLGGSVVSDNIYIADLTVGMLLLIIASRYYFDCCIIKRLHNKKNIFQE